MMQIQKLLMSASANVRTLGQRLSVQASATHGPSDRADLNEWIQDCDAQAQALTAIAAAYGPIIQSAIEMGCSGLSHRIKVEYRSKSALTGEEIFVNVSEHIFEVAELQLN